MPRAATTFSRPLPTSSTPSLVERSDEYCSAKRIPSPISGSTRLAASPTRQARRVAMTAGPSSCQSIRAGSFNEAMEACDGTPASKP
mgnify:CR=1 FL=1